MPQRKLGVALTAIILLWSADARGDATSAMPTAAETMPSENVRLSSGAGMLEVGTRRFTVPQFSRVIAPPAWDKLDAELRRLQDVETRLKAENLHMKQATRGWQPGYKTLLLAATSALATGIYLGHRL